MTPARTKPATPGTPQGEAAIQAAWIAEALVAPLTEALAPRVTEALRRQPPVERIAYSPEEVAHAIGVSRAKVYEWVGAGVLPSVKIDGRRLIRVDALNTWLEHLEKETAEEIAAAQPVRSTFGRTA